MKLPRKIFRFRLNRTSLLVLVIISVVLSLLLGIGIQALVRGANPEISQVTNEGCKYTANSPIRDLEPISFAYGTVKKGDSISAGQYIGYRFQAQAGEIFSYTTRDNICILLYTPDQQFLIDRKPQSLKEGQYSVLLSTPSGSTTFNLEMSLKSPISENQLPIPSQAINQTPVPKLSISGSDTLLGHYQYNEASQSQLMIIGSYAQESDQRFEYFDKEAGKALMKLIYTAREQGAWIVPVSGFRDLERQKLLFKSQIAKKGSEVAAAKVSAPPGHSEHHTGYAIDLTDGQFPNQDITNEFINTKAYRWLTLHAQEFGFEMSFLQNNPEGVMFEPWHWRFVGNSDAITTFAKARR
jgi:zinc D-Ala-D-Ala carboxypeptidase